MGVQKGCVPPSICAWPHSHTLPLCTHVGAHCHLLPVPFCSPALVCSPFHLPAAPARVAHGPTCTPSPLHACRGTASPFHTPALVHPTHPFTCGSPAWVAPHLICMPFARTRGHYDDSAGCTIPHSVCPLPLRATLPLAHIPPVLLCPWHVHKGGGHAGGAGCINWRGGHGVVQVEGTGRGCAISPAPPGMHAEGEGMRAGRGGVHKPGG